MFKLFNKKIKIITAILFVFVILITPLRFDGLSFNLNTLSAAGPSDEIESCGGGDVVFGEGIMPCLMELLATGVNTLITVSVFILSAAASLFEVLLKFSVQDFAGLIDGTDGFRKAWGVFRDFANIFFIFIMLYIAIGTVLQLSGVDWKKMISKVIIIALLINFSWPITRVVIDSGNILALYFYNQITENGTKKVSEQMGKALRLQNSTFLAGTPSQAGLDLLEAGGLSIEEVANNQALRAAYDNAERQSTDGESVILNLLKIVLQGSGSILVLLASAFMFVAGGVMFLARTGWLVALMILSPFAFILMAFPKGSKFMPKEIGDFWGILIKQTFFAPVYMAMLWLTLLIIIKAGGNSPGESGRGLLSLGQQISSTAAGDVWGVVIYYTFVLMMLFFALKTASSMGASTAGFFQGKFKEYLNKTRASAGRNISGLGRNTVGKAAFGLANSERLRNFAGGSLGGVLGGRLLLRNLDNVANSSFGGTALAGEEVKGYKDSREAKAKEVVERGKRYATDQRTGKVDPNILQKYGNTRGKIPFTNIKNPLASAGQKASGDLGDLATSEGIKGSWTYDTTTNRWTPENKAVRDARKDAYKESLQTVRNKINIATSVLTGNTGLLAGVTLTPDELQFRADLQAHMASSATDSGRGKVVEIFDKLNGQEKNLQAKLVKEEKKDKDK